MHLRILRIYRSNDGKWGKNREVGKNNLPKEVDYGGSRACIVKLSGWDEDILILYGIDVYIRIYWGRLFAIFVEEEGRRGWENEGVGRVVKGMGNGEDRGKRRGLDFDKWRCWWDCISWIWYFVYIIKWWWSKVGSPRCLERRSNFPEVIIPSQLRGYRSFIGLAFPKNQFSSPQDSLLWWCKLFRKN